MQKIINKVYNVSNDLNKKIILIADIHYYSKKDIILLDRVYENIKKICPNYICVSGDVIDKSSVDDIEYLLEFLKKLSDICKVILVLGNHEYYIDKNKNIFGLNNDYLNKLHKINNLYLLQNTNKVIDNINFIGLDLTINHYVQEKESVEDFKKYIKYIKIEESTYNILLCHSPENLCKNEIIDKLNISLALCGHMHGGAVPTLLRCIFNNRGLISPNRRLFPKYAYGNIKKEKKNIIITSGVKVMSESHFKQLRFLFTPEIVEINL